MRTSKLKNYPKKIDLVEYGMSLITVGALWKIGLAWLNMGISLIPYLTEGGDRNLPQAIWFVVGVL